MVESRQLAIRHFGASGLGRGLLETADGAYGALKSNDMLGGVVRERSWTRN